MARPPSAKSILRKEKKQSKTPIASGMFLPNHSGDHSRGDVKATPERDYAPVNKKYVDGKFPVTHASTTGQTADDHHDESHNINTHVMGDNKIIHTKAAGAITEISLGAAGTYLKSAGDNADLIWATPAAGLWEVDGTETQLITADDIDMQDLSILNSKYVKFKDSTSTIAPEYAVKLGTGDDAHLCVVNDDLIIANVTADQDIYFNVNDGGVTKGCLTMYGATGNVRVGESANHIEFTNAAIVPVNAGCDIGQAAGNTFDNAWLAGTLSVTGIATLGDSSQMASSAAPTADADIANKKYVDDLLARTAIRVSLSENQTTGAGNSYTLIEFDTESFDELGEFNTTTHKFTCTEAGIYLIHLKVTNQSADNGSLNEPIIYLNDAEYVYAHQYPGVTGYADFQLTTMMKLAINDEVTGYMRCVSANEVMISGGEATVMEIARVA